MSSEDEARAPPFVVENLPCPQCGGYSIVGVLLRDEAGKHQHTRYFCTFWHSGERMGCGWEGWFTPGWDAEGDAALPSADDVLGILDG